MSSEAPVLHSFFVYAPDKQDDGCFERRLKVRAAHLVAAGQLIQKGVILMGGALLTPESIGSPTSNKKMVGSAMIYQAETIEDVRRVIENDIYYKEGVWDPEALVITPFLQAAI